MPASGVSPFLPNMASSRGTRSVTLARCRLNTPTDMPRSQSTSKVRMVRW